jgi:hypothetical protein
MTTTVSVAIAALLLALAVPALFSNLVVLKCLLCRERAGSCPKQCMTFNLLLSDTVQLLLIIAYVVPSSTVEVRCFLCRTMTFRIGFSRGDHWVEQR